MQVTLTATESYLRFVYPSTPGGDMLYCPAIFASASDDYEQLGPELMMNDHVSVYDRTNRRLGVATTTACD